MQKVISQDGTSIAYDRYGSGPALIFVHGATEHRAVSQTMTKLAELLAPDFTVYHYDRRGRGDSGDTPPYAIEREIEDIDALIQVAGGSAYALGMSSGAVLTLRAAAHGIGLRKIALYEPPLILDDSRPPLPADYVAQLNSMVQSGRRGDAVALFMTAAVGMPAEYVAPMRGEPFWPGIEAIAHTIAYDGAIMGNLMSGDPSVVGQWTTMQVPTLVIGGTGSPAFMQESAQALANALPNGQYEALADQTHDVDPTVLAPVIKQYFAV